MDIKDILCLFRRFLLMDIALYKKNIGRSLYMLAVMMIDHHGCLMGLNISGL